jgi:hypothetical protein
MARSQIAELRFVTFKVDSTSNDRPPEHGTEPGIVLAEKSACSKVVPPGKSYVCTPHGCRQRRRFSPRTLQRAGYGAPKGSQGVGCRGQLGERAARTRADGLGLLGTLNRTARFQRAAVSRKCQYGNCDPLLSFMSVLSRPAGFIVPWDRGLRLPGVPGAHPWHPSLHEVGAVSWIRVARKVVRVRTGEPFWRTEALPSKRRRAAATSDTDHRDVSCGERAGHDRDPTVRRGSAKTHAGSRSRNLFLKSRKSSRIHPRRPA